LTPEVKFCYKEPLSGSKGNSNMPHIVIDETRCKGCGLCTIACPKHLVTMSDSPNSLGFTVAVFSDPEKCTGCALCAEMCPDVAIAVFKEQKS
jgi:2-oxoglutarate ferredoxin oxidoreductase subunit delta